ncbi:MAG: bifunctional acetate--CoA ligase family protein/GNAT family N-acetyltransferase [Verrucomicrobiales bacterium]|nr:bifunctional acetate--CoA ligase family protein/GNAT family N-acetyltransferase [Verrucomicrobiales bacterium]
MSVNPLPVSGRESAHDILLQGRRHPLESIFAPSSVAIVGASESLGSVGRSLVENLARFSGKVYLVNPKHPSVLGQKAYPNLEALPECPDLAVIATPAATVAGVVAECVTRGVKGAIILSAGFKEVGPEGVRLEQEVLNEARKGSLRIVGPNCLGVMMPHLQLNATFAKDLAKPGKVAFLSQSGALCTAILDWSFRENVGFSTFVSVGSMLDVGWGDLITYFGDDPQTKSIVCYMESVGDARAFLSAAREIARTKPVIVLKVGHTDAAAKAAASHTGALTGSDAVLDAAFRRAGVVRVATLSELFDLAEVLSKQPRPHGPRLAIVTNAGGPGVLATDALVSNGGTLAPLLPETINDLNRVLPPQWSHRNPIDVLGDANAERFAQAVQRASDDPTTDGVLALLTPQAMTESTATARQLCACAMRMAKPILASWMGGASVDEGKAILNEAGITTFDTPDAAARAFTLMWQNSARLQAIYETPDRSPSEEPSGRQRSVVSQLLANVRRDGRTLLTELESKEVIKRYGIPTVVTQLANTAEEAVQRAEEIGYPVVLKLHSETLTHKTDVDGVHLNLTSAPAIRQAWDRIKAGVERQGVPQAFQGVTVQPMVDRTGYELILGSSVDPQFGPVILFGAGGQMVEVFQDTVLALPPLNSTLARRLIERTRVSKALHGFRGKKGVDMARLTDLLVRFSILVLEQPWIAEIDLNPILISPEQLVALDARVVLHPPSMLPTQLPKPAIRPYPTEYSFQGKLKNGREVILRPISPEDEPLMVQFHRRLSGQSVYQRYFAPLKLDERIAHDRLSRLCFIDYDREMALVAQLAGSHASGSEILAVGRLSRSHGRPEAEFALTVNDEWQGQGLGTQLLQRLVQIGRTEGLKVIRATILSENHHMLEVAKRVGFKILHSPGWQDYRVEMEL